jgi:hypothetical protein
MDEEPPRSPSKQRNASPSKKKKQKIEEVEELNWDDSEVNPLVDLGEDSLAGLLLQANSKSVQPKNKRR